MSNSHLPPPPHPLPWDSAKKALRLRDEPLLKVLSGNLIHLYSPVFKVIYLSIEDKVNIAGIRLQLDYYLFSGRSPLIYICVGSAVHLSIEEWVQKDSLQK